MAQDGASQPLAGITVELGRWEGTVVDDQYGTRTAQRREPPWARLVVIARTVTDAHGRYEFAQAPVTVAIT
jgi:protocatechuate 3,4-dioxygenase beta subunit